MADALARIVDETTVVVIYGAELIDISVNAAAASAGAAAASATAADTSADAAEAAADTAGAFQSAVLAAVAGLDISDQLPLQAVSVAALQATVTTSMTEGRQVFLSAARLEGVFKWRGGNQSANVTADPYKGLWIPPSAAATGASGAWQRVVTDNTFRVEWWLPDVMPDDCDVQLNTLTALNSVLISEGSKIILPARLTGVSNSWFIRVAGLTVQAFGKECPLWGVDGTMPHDMICITESNCTFFNVWGGGTYGVSVGGTESPIFHTYHEFVGEASYKSVENTTFIYCGAFDAMNGLRLGYCTQPDGTILQGKNNKVIGFRGFNLSLMGMEIFNQRGAQIRDFTLTMGPAYSGGHLGIRFNSNFDCLIDGGRMIGLNETSGVGILFDIGSTSTTGTSHGRDNIIRNINFEQIQTCLQVACHEGTLLLDGITYSGRTNGDTTFLYAVAVGSVAGRENKIRHMTVRNCKVENATRFAQIGGDVGWFEVEDNRFISNDNAAARFALLQAFTGENLRGRIRRNYALHKQNNQNPILFSGTFDATFEVEIDDNDLIPNSSTGKLVEYYGSGALPTVISRDPFSNRSVAAARWTAERPSLDLVEYT